MLVYQEEQLAAIIFHELAHQQLYVKDDTRFSEAYARFVEQAGVQAWLAQQGDTLREQAWRASEEASLDFNRLLATARTDLLAIYEGTRPEQEKRLMKAQRFELLATEYAGLVESRWGGRDYYAGWFSRDLNNARLALIASYEGGSCAFDRLFEQAAADFTRFYELARQKSRLPRDQRQGWLDQSCGFTTAVIAPAGDL
jgi:predicted aminopeptidase